ncbi:hypothetical protein RF11_09921 [Thelohanellus kitauei]|uniref:Uncharacterized protein n=1 Tax=Thelohanellus kitauei TaxID=669202 RepID=A0A0C2N010_THEKT|nr:hypothetical protein RF11_09921 [Thelohanellus kitauei]
MKNNCIHLNEKLILNTVVQGEKLVTEVKGWIFLNSWWETFSMINNKKCGLHPPLLKVVSSGSFLQLIVFEYAPERTKRSKRPKKCLSKTQTLHELISMFC